MNVLIIPEDFRNDQYILRPLFSRLFRDLGASAARVRVCQNPLLGGVVEALKSERLQEITEMYGGMVDLFILCVDRDGNTGRRQRLDEIEAEFGGTRAFAFFAENAWEELETWLLAGLVLPAGWQWADVRAEVDVKERFYERLARERGLDDGPGYGRKELGEEAARRIDAIRQKCPEDFDALARRIESLLSRTER